MGFRVSDPTKTDKSVVPSDTTDQHSNDKLECNVSRVATSKPKKNKNPSADLTRFMHPSMQSKEAREVHW